MRWPLLLLLVSCGASWTTQDAQNAADSANQQAQLEILCGREDAAPTCQPAAVRAIERASWCATASMLARHKEPVEDAGIRCLP